VIVVTGGAGFVGSNLIWELNRAGRSDVLVVDNLTDARKFKNLVGADIADYIDKQDFLSMVASRTSDLDEIELISHQGACTSTTESDGRYMMKNNYEYSKALLDLSLERQLPMIYASSAAVYGGGTSFGEDPTNEAPLNVYGFSKLLFDVHVRRVLAAAKSQIVGLRYFNVFGPREAHKGPMASMVLQLDDQVAASGKARLFGPTEGYGAGEQRRDFVHVQDVVRVNLWFMDNPDKSGIFNCGTGASRTFNDLASEVLRFRGDGMIEYIPFPESLDGKYQSYTQADLEQLRAAGYEGEFTSLEDGIQEYLTWRREQIDE
jgi:ADP-L-glycero-D-manno-heptose 6-epimerase